MDLGGDGLERTRRSRCGDNYVAMLGDDSAIGRGQQRLRLVLRRGGRHNARDLVELGADFAAAPRFRQEGELHGEGFRTAILEPADVHSSGAEEELGSPAMRFETLDRAEKVGKGPGSERPGNEIGARFPTCMRGYIAGVDSFNHIGGGCSAVM